MWKVQVILSGFQELNICSMSWSSHNTKIMYFFLNYNTFNVIPKHVEWPPNLSLLLLKCFVDGVGKRLPKSDMITKTAIPITYNPSYHTPGHKTWATQMSESTYKSCAIYFSLRISILNYIVRPRWNQGSAMACLYWWSRCYLTSDLQLTTFYIN